MQAALHRSGGARQEVEVAEKKERALAAEPQAQRGAAARRVRRFAEAARRVPGRQWTLGAVFWPRLRWAELLRPVTPEFAAGSRAQRERPPSLQSALRWERALVAEPQAQRGAVARRVQRFAEAAQRVTQWLEGPAQLLRELGEQRRAPASRRLAAAGLFRGKAACSQALAQLRLAGLVARRPFGVRWQAVAELMWRGGGQEWAELASSRRRVRALADAERLHRRRGDAVAWRALPGLELSRPG